MDKMKVAKICPKCKLQFNVDREMELVSVIEYLALKKFDKQYKCYYRKGSYYCGLLLVQKAAIE